MCRRDSKLHSVMGRYSYALQPLAEQNANRKKIDIKSVILWPRDLFYFLSAQSQCKIMINSFLYLLLPKLES
jgi:hypothetical protein